MASSGSISAINGGTIAGITSLSLSGHTVFGTDNTYDLGSASFRPRSVYAGSNFRIDSGGTIVWTSRSFINSPADGKITLFNNAASGFTMLAFGGNNATEPALKRSSTQLQVRLGDDSSYAPFACGALTVNADSTLAEGVDLALGTSTGTKIGTATSQKLGFWNATPVIQPSGYTQTYSTADKTHANPTAATLTVTDGAGSNDNTIGAITADASVIAAVQEIVDEINKLIADVADVKQFTNSILDDMQTMGLVA
jgi:hypothetical protein